MYYAIFLDDYLKDSSNLLDLGRVYKAVIVKSDIPPTHDYIVLTEEEALAWRFVDVDAEKITVRPGGEIFGRLKDSLERVQAFNKSGQPLDYVEKYKYTITDKDRRDALALRNKIERFI
jgi:hypothetical protein